MSQDARRVSEFSPTIAAYAKNIYEGIIKQHDTKTAKGVEEYWMMEQGQQAKIPPEYKEGQDLSFREFVAMLELANAVGDTDPHGQDFTRPLSNYFISSSHNTYLMGNQLYGEATTNGYKNVLLRGCRCVEIDVWDGQESDSESSDSSSSDEEEEGGIKARRTRSDSSKSTKSNRSNKTKWKKRLGINKVKEKALEKAGRGKSNNIPIPETPDEADSERKEFFSKPERWRSNTSNRVEPVVLHGYTATKEIPFREVCMTIGKYAFMTSSLPVIVSLEVHTSIEQQKIMVEIMKESFGDNLFDLPEAADDVSLPNPKELLRKILIKVKYSPPKKANPQDAEKPEGERKLEAVDSETNSEHDSHEPAHGGNAPPSKIYEALSRLGVYTRSFHFSSFDQPGKKDCHHLSCLLTNHQQKQRYPRIFFLYPKTSSCRCTRRTQLLCPNTIAYVDGSTNRS